MTSTIVDIASWNNLQKKMLLNQIPAWPPGADLVIYESGTDPREGMVLYGWDEVDTFAGNFQHPHYCYLKMEA